MDIRIAKSKYMAHRRNAKGRGHAFTLTFDEWLALWADRIDQMGNNRGQYVMCRKDDCGGYTPGNVYIGTQKHNKSVRGHGREISHALSAPIDWIPQHRYTMPSHR